MTLKYFAGLLITGTNADRTGGTWTNLPAGWRFFTTDTFVMYYWDGAAWNAQTGTSGEANTASNVGTGQGVWKAKTGVDLSFRSLTATSSKIALTNNTNDIGVDVTEANLALANISGTLAIGKGGTGQTTATAGFDALSPMSAVGDIIVGSTAGTRIKLARGAADLPLKVNSGGTDIEYSALAVAGGGSGATTLTGILKGNGTSAYTAVTAPAGTIVGTTDTQTLTNKSIDAKTNTLSYSHVHPSVKRTGLYSGAGNAAVVCSGMLQGTGTTIAVAGGGFSGIVRTGGMRGRYVSSTTINSLGGCRFNSTLLTERSLNPLLETKIGLLTANTTERAFIGYTSATTAPASAADPLANLSGVGFFYDSAVDANWHIIQNSGGAASDTTTIPNVAAADLNAHTFAIKAVTDTKFQYSYAGGAYADITTVIPASTTGLGPMWYVESTAGTAARTIDCYWMWMECDP